jgi:predicted outer membrane protein
MRKTIQTRAIAVALLAALSIALAGCGTPATVTPAKNPLPGFKLDIQAAHQAATQLQNTPTGSSGPTP